MADLMMADASGDPLDLYAGGPDPRYAAALALFGRFVGVWSLRTVALRPLDLT
jgi:hypothetical protein